MKSDIARLDPIIFQNGMWKIGVRLHKFTFLCFIFCRLVKPDPENLKTENIPEEPWKL